MKQPLWIPCAKRAIPLLLIAASMPAWAETASQFSSDCPARSKPMARLELLFGASFKGGKVGPRDFARFIEKEVTPRFPDGLSVFEGHGQWRAKSGGLIREPSRLLLIWHEPDSASDAKIEAIRTAYKRRFKQQSVMRVDGSSCVSF
ncbi:DUF3574 domain-containing protein [Methylocapsa polymorpha]|uniref:DUF3574 domain-containing protein n=1 Tax=Methylocapsa polymorpha TaxID=3080828 RepID=A0ABZ0HV95_9HYPH|nr:DUF3574 domain-containing protein [Methylocapsa sp. RX1]